jgi:CheY-like chemotaxis protein
VGRIARTSGIYLTAMATYSTLLCIHRNPAQLSLLQENGYELVTATNGCDGLRLLMSRPVDAIVLEYHLGLLDGAIVAAEIRKARPQLPIVMLADYLELPEGALKSVDALVTKSDGAHFLSATIYSVLNTKIAKRLEAERKTPVFVPPDPPRNERVKMDPCGLNPTQPAEDDRLAPFSSRVWRDIKDGSIEF